MRISQCLVQCSATTMSSRVRAVNTTHVHPTQTSPPTCHGMHQLSFLDLFHVSRRPIQRLFFFDGPDLPPFPKIVATLQSSLADTLAVYLPLAGKLAFRASSGDVVIDYSPDAVASGVRFVEAEFYGDADDMRRLARDPDHDTEAFEQLVPELVEETHQLPSPILAVQVTKPAVGDGGAVAVGVSVLHAVADGLAFWQFMRAWSAVALEGSLAGLPLPTFDRSGVRHPKGDEMDRMVLRMFAPAMPIIKVRSSSSDATTEQCRRTFVLRANEIRSLKQHILLAKSRADGEPSKPPSTYIAISSLVWTSLVRCKPKPTPQDDDAYYYFMVNADCRHRLRPPLAAGFFGNCIKPCFARASGGDLRGEAGLAHAASALRDAIREYIDELGDQPLCDIERCVAVYRDIPPGKLATVGASHRFMAYETDFGWGKPSRVELVSLFARELVTLLSAREEGAVHVSVALDRAAMEAFAAYFTVPASTSNA